MYNSRDSTKKLKHKNECLPITYTGRRERRVQMGKVTTRAAATKREEVKEEVIGIRVH